MNKFKAKLEIIDGNPFVFIPIEVLSKIFIQSKRNKSPIPVQGRINEKEYKQTLMKYSGAWRLYVNMKMLKDSPRRIGEHLEIEIEFDPSDRSISPHPALTTALAENEKANKVFKSLSPSKQKEIIRYISNLKTKQSIERNVKRAINFLLGKESFVGRDRP